MVTTASIDNYNYIIDKNNEQYTLHYIMIGMIVLSKSMIANR